MSLLKLLLLSFFVACLFSCGDGDGDGVTETNAETETNESIEQPNQLQVLFQKENENIWDRHEYNWISTGPGIITSRLSSESQIELNTEIYKSGTQIGTWDMGKGVAECSIHIGAAGENWTISVDTEEHPCFVDFIATFLPD